VVYDVTDKASFDHVKTWMNDIDKFAKEGVFRILVGNKCDLENLRQVPKEKGQQLANSYGIPFFETSAKANKNIEQLFLDSATAFIDKQIKSGNDGFNRTQKIINSGINLNTEVTVNPKKGKCC